MNTKRILGVIVGAGLIVAVILLALGFKSAPEALGSKPASTGYGDLRLYEKQLEQSALDAQVSHAIEVGENIRRAEAKKAFLASGIQGNNNSYAGIGDLRRYEQKSALMGQRPTFNIAPAGFGELRRFEQEQAILKAVGLASNNTYAGMGDLHRYELKLAPKGLGPAFNIAPAGFGDLRRFEQEQAFKNSAPAIAGVMVVSYGQQNADKWFAAQTTGRTQAPAPIITGLTGGSYGMQNAANWLAKTP